MNEAICYLASHVRHCRTIARYVNGCARNAKLIPALCIGTWASSSQQSMQPAMVLRSEQQFGSCAASTA